MNAVKINSLSEMEEKYYEITELYDLAQELINTVESEFVHHRSQQFSLVEPLVEELSEAADVLTDEFMAIAESKGKPKNKNRIESAMRKVYAAIDHYHKQVGAVVGETHTGFRNIADPIVKKIKRQMESVIAVFIDFVVLSLDRIMHKSEVEELKQRQEKIAIMLHAAAQGQGT